MITIRPSGFSYSAPPKVTIRPECDGTTCPRYDRLPTALGYHSTAPVDSLSVRSGCTVRRSSLLPRSGGDDARAHLVALRDHEQLGAGRVLTPTTTRLAILSGEKPGGKIGSSPSSALVGVGKGYVAQR